LGERFGIILFDTGFKFKAFQLLTIYEGERKAKEERKKKANKRGRKQNFITQTTDQKRGDKTTGTVF
jgi:hypothetical protein